jgi:hypothetical protein
MSLEDNFVAPVSYDWDAIIEWAKEREKKNQARPADGR